MKKALTPLTEIEGIGEKLRNAMWKAGFYYAEDLIAESFEIVSGKLEPLKGLTRQNLYSKYIPQAKLLRIENMTGQFAEGLVKSGILNYRDLVYFSTETILNALESRKEEGLIPEVPSRELIIDFQLKAGRLVETGLVYMIIFQESNKKLLKNVKVQLIKNSTDTYTTGTYTSNVNGMLVIDGLCYGKYNVQIELDGYQSKHFSLEFTHDNAHKKIRVQLETGERTPLITDEFNNEVVNPMGCEFKEVKVELNDLPAVPAVVVSKINNTTVTLISLWRKRVDNVLYYYTFNMDMNELPDQTKIEAVLIPDNSGKYGMTNLSMAEYRIQREREIGENKYKEWQNRRSL